MTLVFSGSKVDVKQGLPSFIREINEERYFEVRKRVIGFKTSLLFDKSCELRLTADDINTVFRDSYISYSQRNAKDKAFNRIEYFDIRRDELLLIQMFPFLTLEFNPLSLQRCLRFNLVNGEVLELQSTLTSIDYKVGDLHTSVRSDMASNLIYRILSCTNENLGAVGSPRTQSRNIAAPLVQKLRQVQVKDGELILRS